MSLDDQRYLFRPIQRTKNGEGLRQSGKISYTCLRELLKKKVTDLGLPPTKFGLHSLRAGGATAAANARVPDRLFKRHGRWKSENAKDGYVKDHVQSRLEVSRSLGLYPINIIFDTSFVTLAIVIQLANLCGGTTQWFCCMCGCFKCMVRELYFLSVERRELDGK